MAFVEQRLLAEHLHESPGKAQEILLLEHSVGLSSSTLSR